MEEIAARVGRTTRSVYHHFQDKEALGARLGRETPQNTHRPPPQDPSQNLSYSGNLPKGAGHRTAQFVPSRLGRWSPRMALS
ncbi:MAG: helix-turn-helix transcriptional regulator [Actinomycetia bacterium]|nr:helix-turn-helix transcriptional regulator [Actinomycetes bacterium]